MLRKLSSPPEPSAHLEKDADVKNIAGSLRRMLLRKMQLLRSPGLPKKISMYPLPSNSFRLHRGTQLIFPLSLIQRKVKFIRVSQAFSEKNQFMTSPLSNNLRWKLIVVIFLALATLLMRVRRNKKMSQGLKNKLLLKEVLTRP